MLQWRHGRQERGNELELEPDARSESTTPTVMTGSILSLTHLSFFCLLFHSLPSSHCPFPSSLIFSIFSLESRVSWTSLTLSRYTQSSNSSAAVSSVVTPVLRPLLTSKGDSSRLEVPGAVEEHASDAYNLDVTIAAVPMPRRCPS